jgi:hypothetical protein
VKFLFQEPWVVILMAFFFASRGPPPGQELWSFKAIQKSGLPRVRNAGLCRTPVDFFILARLEERNLTFQEEADGRILARRLTFDLHGVPPTPEELAQFLEDDSAPVSGPLTL